MLASDPKAEKAAASLSVKVGTLKDPKELQDVLDDSNLHKWLDIYDNISSLGLANKSISDPGTGLFIEKIIH